MTLKDAYTAIKAKFTQAYAFSPFTCGIALGYFGRPLAQPILSVALSLAKALLKHL